MVDWKLKLKFLPSLYLPITQDMLNDTCETTKYAFYKFLFEGMMLNTIHKRRLEGEEVKFGTVLFIIFFKVIISFFNYLSRDRYQNCLRNYLIPVIFIACKSFLAYSTSRKKKWIFTLCVKHGNLLKFCVLLALPNKLAQLPAVDMQNAPAKLPSKVHMFAYLDVLAQSLCITKEASWCFLNSNLMCSSFNSFLKNCSFINFVCYKNQFVESPTINHVSFCQKYLVHLTHSIFLLSIFEKRVCLEAYMIPRVWGIWRNFMSVLALLLGNQKFGLFEVFSFIPGMIFMGLSDPVENLSWDYLTTYGKHSFRYKTGWFSWKGLTFYIVLLSILTVLFILSKKFIFIPMLLVTDPKTRNNNIQGGITLNSTQVVHINCKKTSILIHKYHCLFQLIIFMCGERVLFLLLPYCMFVILQAIESPEKHLYAGQSSLLDTPSSCNGTVPNGT
ncbi:hypothetical protein VP01_303g4 [Puccinia sorghi]|uniref:Uncharacterized protein n=1 Tax=Puccinia sorghi TaxID=27349 RepID=A0A0L6V011_9BASI|nr:hypothetical protein VP01_303g4 [Puccinia sorghi]